MQLQSVQHAAASAQASQPHTPQATLPRGGAGGAAEAQRLKCTIARLQNDLDAINKREDTEQNRALWRGLMEILPPKRVCETLLEYVLQEVRTTTCREDTLRQPVRGETCMESSVEGQKREDGW